MNQKLIHLHLMVGTLFGNDITNSLINFLFVVHPCAVLFFVTPSVPCIPDYVSQVLLFILTSKSLFLHVIWNVKDHKDDIVLANLHCICDCNQWKNLWHKSDWSFLIVSFHHIGDHFDFLQNCHKFWWLHWIFANFGDFFIEIFSDSLKFSLFLVNNFSPILVRFSLSKMSPILVTFL